MNQIKYQTKSNFTQSWQKALKSSGDTGLSFTSLYVEIITLITTLNIINVINIIKIISIGMIPHPPHPFKGIQPGKSLKPQYAELYGGF